MKLYIKTDGEKIVIASNFELPNTDPYEDDEITLDNIYDYKFEDGKLVLANEEEKRELYPFLYFTV